MVNLSSLWSILLLKQTEVFSLQDESGLIHMNDNNYKTDFLMSKVAQQVVNILWHVVFEKYPTLKVQKIVNGNKTKTREIQKGTGLLTVTSFLYSGF